MSAAGGGGAPFFGSGPVPPPNMYQVPTFNPSALHQPQPPQGGHPTGLGGGGPRGRMYPRAQPQQQQQQQQQTPVAAAAAVTQQPPVAQDFAPPAQMQMYQQQQHQQPPVPPPGTHDEHIAYYAQQQPYQQQQQQQHHLQQQHPDQQQHGYDQQQNKFVQQQNHLQFGQDQQQYDQQSQEQQQQPPGYVDYYANNNYDYNNYQQQPEHPSDQQQQQQHYYGEEYQQQQQQDDQNWQQLQQQEQVQQPDVDQVEVEQQQQHVFQEENVGPYEWSPELNQWISKEPPGDAESHALADQEGGAVQEEEELHHPPPPAEDDGGGDAVAAAAVNPPDVATASGHRPPDILLNDPFIPSSDRNLYMQTGQLDEGDEEEGQQQLHQHHHHHPHPLPQSEQVREPVDGGNEEFEQQPAPNVQPQQRHLNDDADDVDIPLDRLVLGQQSDHQQQGQQQYQAPHRVVTGMNDANHQPPPTSSSPSTSPLSSHASSSTSSAATAAQNRVIPGNNLDGTVAQATVNAPGALPSPVKTNLNQQAMLTSTPTGADKGSSLDGDDDDDDVGGRQRREVRSEAVGSDRRDQSVMGPPPMSVSGGQAHQQQHPPPPPPSGRRRDVTGADSDGAPLPAAAASNRQMNNGHNRQQQPDSELDDRHSERSSEQQQQQRHQRQSEGSGVNRRRKDRRRRSRSRSSSGDEDDLVRDSSDGLDEDESGRRNSARDPHPRRRGGDDHRGDRDGDGGDHRGAAVASHRKEYRRHHDDPPKRHHQHDSNSRHERSYRDDYRGHRDNNRGYYDDRSFVDDSMNQSRRNDRTGRDQYLNDSVSASGGGGRYRGPAAAAQQQRYDDSRDSRGYYGREPSRPSSRSGSLYEEQQQRYYDPRYSNNYHMYPQPSYPGPYQPHPGAAAAYAPTAVPMLPQAVIDSFRKHWERYLQSPELFEQLRVTNLAQYQLLNEYYRNYGEYLRLPPIVPVATPAFKLGDDSSQHRSSSRASVHSGQSSDVAIAPSSSSAFHRLDASLHRPESRQGGDESTIYTDPDADPRYQPTFIDHHDNNDASSSALADAHRRLTPTKFSSPHVEGVFSVLGVLAKVDAKSPLDGQSATIELHSLQAIMARSDLGRDLLDFPGPLVPGKTHKSEVIRFCQTKIQRCPANMVDRDSYILIWELMMLLLRQKNAIEGSDIAELLLKDREATLPKHQDGNQEGDEEDEEDAEVSHIVRHDRTAVTATFRDYLMYGHKKEALEYAMSRGLWGHALFLASKMDARSHSNVMLRFANGMAVTDPLQTLYQLMSGRQPIAVKECSDKKWGDWRPHLAMILANPSENPELNNRSILTLGDTLLAKGFLHAAHFCYLFSGVEFGGYGNAAAKIVLIGSDRSAVASDAVAGHQHLHFDAFATNEAIQCTEIFEYAQKQSNASFSTPSLQYFKLVYALRLIDHGQSSLALYYLEQIADWIVRSCGAGGQGLPPQADLGLLTPEQFVQQVLTFSDRLKFLDPSYTTRTGEVSEMEDPKWLGTLKETVRTFEQNNYQQQQHYDQSYYYGEGYSDQQQQEHQNQEYQSQQQEDYQQQQHEEFQSQQPSGDFNNYYDGGADPIMMRPIKEEETHHQDHMHSSDPNAYAQDGGSSMSSPGSSTSSSSQNSPRHDPLNQGPPSFNPQQQFHPQPPPPPSSQQQNAAKPPSGDSNYFSNIQTQPKPPQQQLQQQPKQQQPPQQQQQKQQQQKPPAQKGKGGDKAAIASNSGPGMFGRLLGKFIKLPPNQVHLPDEKNQSIVWDEDKKAWVDIHGNPDGEDGSGGAAAPPSDVELSRNNSTADFSSPPARQMQPQQMQQQMQQQQQPAGSLMGPPMMSNKFAGGLAKKRGGLAGRIDVFKNSQSAPVLNAGMVDNNNGLPPPSMHHHAPLPPMMMLPPMAPSEDGAADHQDGGADLDAGEGEALPTATPMFFNPNQFNQANRNLHA